MVQLPAALAALLDDLKNQLPALLGQNLVGVYLYGSLTQGAFDAQRSDADGIVVTRRPLTQRQFVVLRRWLGRIANSNRWARRFQLTFLLKEQLLVMDADACLYQFRRLSRCRSDGNPIIWLNVLDGGLVLVGPSPRSFVPTITEKMLDDALARELNYLRAEIATKPKSQWRNKPSYRVYAVLTMCRILYSAQKRTIVSKPVAARWAIAHVPSKHRRLVRHALASVNHRGSTRLALVDLRAFN